MELGGDFGGGAAFAGVLKDLALAVGERIFVGAPGFRGEGGIDGAETGVDAANGFGKLGGGAVFEQVAACAGIQCAAQVAWAREGGEDDDAGLRLCKLEVGGHFKAGALGHFDIGNENVGHALLGELESFASVGGLGDYGDVGFEIEEGGECSAEHGLVFGEENTNGCGRLGRGAHETAASWKGRSMTRRVPLSGPVPRSSEKWPPRDSTRSRMPRRPLPSRAMACWPSSSTTRRRWPASVTKRRRQVVARA